MKTSRIFTTNLSVEESSARAAATLRELDAKDLERAPNAQPVRGFVRYDERSFLVDIWSKQKSGRTEVSVKVFDGKMGDISVGDGEKREESADLVASHVKVTFLSSTIPGQCSRLRQEDTQSPVVCAKRTALNPDLVTVPDSWVQKITRGVARCVLMIVQFITLLVFCLVFALCIVTTLLFIFR